MDQKAKFRHTGEYFCIGKAFRGSFLYPEGEPFGDFYKKLAECCREWAKNDFLDYSGAMMTYRFCACASVTAEGLLSVNCEFVLSVRGNGTVKRNKFTHLWREDGCIVKVNDAFLDKLHKKRRSM